MPIHEYECPKCKHKFELITIKISDVKDKVECPKCKVLIDKRIMSSGGFVIHGYNSSNGYSGVMR